VGQVTAPLIRHAERVLVSYREDADWLDQQIQKFTGTNKSMQRKIIDELEKKYDDEGWEVVRKVEETKENITGAEKEITKLESEYKIVYFKIISRIPISFTPISVAVSIKYPDHEIVSSLKKKLKTLPMLATELPENFELYYGSNQLSDDSFPHEILEKAGTKDETTLMVKDV